MEIETGGPAFPCDAIFGRDDAGRPSETNSEGMTLRDYFAAKAMQAFISNARLLLVDKARLARDSYSVADAMLEARKS